MNGKLKIGLGLVGVVSVLAILLPLHERFFGRTRLRFPYQGKPIAEAAYTELASKPGWARSQLEVAPGIKLSGLVRRPTVKSAPWVLFYPGNDDSQLNMGQGFLSRLARDVDWGLAVFAYRGYDSSSGSFVLAEMRGDALQILTKLCASEGVEPSKVHLAGFSIGGYFAVSAAGGAAKAGKRAASLTLLAPVDDIVMYRPSPWEKLTLGDDYQTRPFLDGVPAPVLLVQGSADSALHGPQQGRDIAAALGERARYEELPGVDHVPLLENDDALRLVRTFVLERSP